MSAITAVVFDLGNVLLPFDWGLAAQAIAARCRRSRRELDDYIVTTPFGTQLAIGQLSAQRFYEIVAADLEFQGDYAAFARAYSDMFTADPAMVALAAALKGKLPRYILSNTNPIHIEFILSRFAFMHEFEGYIFSHEVGLEKPDPAIYHHTVRTFGLTPAGTVFIDDILANVEAARAAGWHGIHHRDAGRTRQELTKLGIPPI